MVDVGGFKLFFRIHGDDENLNVVFIPGMGFDSSEWDAVLDKVAERTPCRTIAYDPIGYGSSDFGPEKYDIVNDMQYLKTGLDNSGINKEIILVAHSYGAFIARLFTIAYTNRVKAIVLVEPATVGFNYTIGLNNLVPRDWTGYSEADKRIMSMYPDSTKTMKDKPCFSTDIPLIVITRGKKLWPREMSRYDELWRQYHEAIVAGGPLRKLVVAENSGHMVPSEEPDVIVEEIVMIADRIHRN